jgi:hypothetical protein
LWYEVSDPSFVKFGERWVNSGEDPEEQILQRVKASLGVRKDLFARGQIRLVKFWDVSDLAKSVGRFFKHARVDDYIRNDCPLLKITRVGTTGETHHIELDDPADRVILEINRYLAGHNQTLPTVGLSPWQYKIADEVLTAIQSGHKTILAELCARFGKTLWAGALVKELGTPVTIIASYVLTSFTSFMKELSSFEQFKDLELIEAKDSMFKDKIQAALDLGKQVVVFVSMVHGINRTRRVSYLFDLPVDRLVIVDEADFGMKQVAQSSLLKDARKGNDVVVLMTGTSAEEAGQYWPNAYYTSCTYLELMAEKRAGHA